MSTFPTNADIDAIARVCHEANRGIQAAWPAPGIPVAAAWDDFPEDQRAGVRRGVKLALDGTSAEELHEAWCRDKVAAGWTHGDVKDEEALTHPCLCSYDDLPAGQRVKDRLFAAIVQALGARAPLTPSEIAADLQRTMRAGTGIQ